ncbi:hypothetical protein LK09_02565 [Microbacterium mangrovi]|uniref:DUF58 domain-containing protein n=1 Tax=Microbacterium mangrovi TaxID=1348253 RepID=A0A0B2A8V3_9MICO|nr:DUF58 domain-containing protein [Microbacterium mangrovi]KHK99530.1 hypothetical protein LK09_02565 [Microbacterium mangrovi]
MTPAPTTTGAPATHRSAGDTGSTTELTATRTRVSRRSGRAPALARLAGTTAAAFSRAADAAARVGRSVADTVMPAGWLLLVLVAGGLVAGLVWGWVEALLAGIAALVLLASSIPFLFGARGYEVSVQLSHERVVAGTTVDADVHVRNTGTRTALPGRLDLPVGAGLIELGVPLLRAGHEVVRHLEIPAVARGVIRIGPPTAVRSDPVGILRRERRWEAVHDLYVHPQTVPVPAVSGGLIRDLEGSPVQRLVDADMSFHAIRQYVPGDAQRQIHWKSTAKTGQLMVRQFEQTLRSRLAVVLSVDPGDFAAPDEFELAVSAAASLAVQAVRDGREIEVVTGLSTPRTDRGRSRAIEVLRAPAPRPMLDGFSRIDAAETPVPLEEVCRLASETADSLALAFVVCGAKTDAGRLRRAALAFPPETVVVAVVADQVAHPRRQVLPDLTVLTIGVLADLPGLMFRAVQS